MGPPALLPIQRIFIFIDELIALMLEAARISEKADIQLRTRQYIPEDCELHTRRRENLKSHIHLSNFVCM
jgi:hypothetical protein